MKEKLINIVENIDSCNKARQGLGFAPVARVHCECDGKGNTYWFTNGCISPRELGDLSKFGSFVPKNSNVAIKMQTIEVGTSFDYQQFINLKRFQNHHVVLENRANFQNKTIAIAGDTLLYQFRDIHEFLKELRRNSSDIRDIEVEIEKLKREYEELKLKKDTAAQRGKITKTINDLQREYRLLTQQQEDLKNITIYIRKQGEMRYSLIVDTVQTRIKSQNLYDGKTVIINGGPGTGKSTTMIHRLAYLTDIFAIDEDENEENQRFKLNASQRQQLREAIRNKRDWMFFSPSKMLKEYLAEAMKKEGLLDTEQKVWNWKDYCRKILEENYHLLGGDNDKSNAPFKVCKLEGTLFEQNADIVNEFTNFYLNEFRKIKSQFPTLNTEGTGSAWMVIAKGIEKKFENSENFKLSQFVVLFKSLESVYGDNCKDILRDRNNAIANLANEIIPLLDKNKDIKSELEDLFDLTDGVGELSEKEDDIESEEEKSNEEKVCSKLKSWLKIFSYSRLDETIQLNSEQMLIYEILQPILGKQYDDSIKNIGELMLFEQFAQYTRGVRNIMLNGLPARYKRFRTHLSKIQYKGCDLDLLRTITQRRQGKELHHQEQALLLGFINNLVKQIKASTNLKIKHSFVEAYDDVSRPIIGIDEATDFSVCDIYAMQSLLTREFNSLTLCGDMMQRLTSYGITSWEQLNGIVQNPLVVEMKTSYRQSKRLLDVARNLYYDTMGKTPNYKAFMKSNNVPVPLLYVDVNEDAKVRWISKRIEEVFRAYGEQLPSIAIFVNDKGYIPSFAKRLENTDFFKNNKVAVYDGLNKTPNSVEKYICVYPIEVVKGMEFDVVFFHDVDKYSVDTEMQRRYIYVGVSRAAFFLGITLSEEKKEIEKYFEKGKDWFKI
ncbi:MULTISPECIES: ATP-binding domain-containing protein [unclassified Bacteroides]|uniref:ATP-binding domain-containing protein n=1 Tax=unclassified Bacteroides TaxID=2646097 RepID=UPI0004E2200E|nr:MULTISPECIES: ATP-binding domain-containing protein [unclassified Bacteroides]